MSGLSILQVAHDHPDWTPGGTEIVAHDLARALDARAGRAAPASWSPPPRCSGRRRRRVASARTGTTSCCSTGAYDRFSMTRLDGDGLDRGARRRARRGCGPTSCTCTGSTGSAPRSLPVIRRLAPRVPDRADAARLPADLPERRAAADHRRGRPLPRRAARRCRRCFPEQAAARHALRRAHLLALLAGVDVFVAPSAFLRDRFVDWGIDADRASGWCRTPWRRRPAAARAGGRSRRNRFAFFGNDRAAQGRAGAARRRGAPARTRARTCGSRCTAGSAGRRRSSAPPSQAKLAAAEPLAAASRTLRPRRRGRADAAGRLGRRALDLVGERAAGHRGGPRRGPPGDLLGDRRHGRAGRATASTGCTSRRATSRRWPRPCAAATDPDLWERLAGAARAGEPRRLRRRAPRALPVTSATGWPHDPCRRFRLSAASSAGARVLRASWRSCCTAAGRSCSSRLRRAPSRVAGHLRPARAAGRAGSRNAGARHGAASTGTASRCSTTLPLGGAEVRRRRRGQPVAARARRRASTSRRSRWPSSCARPGRAAGASSASSMRHLLAGRAGRFGGGAVAPRLRPRASSTAAAERDGFVEMVAAPDTGGFFAQGWSMSLRRGTGARRRRRRGPGAARGRGRAFRARRHPAAGPGLLLLRQVLDATRASPRSTRSSSRATAGCCGSTWCAAAAAARGRGAPPRTSRSMLPRLEAPDARRSTRSGGSAGRASPASTRCRRHPAADRRRLRLRAAGARRRRCSSIGWLLDPLHRVERVLIKSTRQPLRASSTPTGARCRGPTSSAASRRTRASPASSTSAT